MKLNSVLSKADMIIILLLLRIPRWGSRFFFFLHFRLSKKEIYNNVTL